MKNTFIEELKKYERKALDLKMVKSCSGKGQCSTDLKQLMSQVTALKQRMAQYRPLLSDDIIVAFESLLWLDLKFKKLINSLLLFIQIFTKNVEYSNGSYRRDSPQDVKEDCTADKGNLPSPF